MFNARNSQLFKIRFYGPVRVYDTNAQFYKYIAFLIVSNGCKKTFQLFL